MKAPYDWIVPDWPAPPGVKSLITTRNGGVSSGAYTSFNLGLRYDKNDGKDADGHTISDDSELGPRLAVAYDTRGDGRQRATATYGRYVSKIADGNVGGSGQLAGNPAFVSFIYRGPVINPAGTPSDQLLSTREALRQLFAWFDSVGGTSNKDPMIFTGASIPGFAARFPEPISSPSVDEITLGYGMQIGNNAFAKVDLIARDWNNFYAARLDLGTGTVTDPLGNVGDVSFTQNNDSLKREYRGIQFQGQWRPKRFNLGATYTYSTLKGNDQGEGAGTATIRNIPLDTWYPEYLNYKQRRPDGFLGQDQRHRARVWLGYQLPTPIGDFDLALLQSYDTGRSYAAIGTIDASGRSTPFPGAPANPGYTLSQLGTTHDYFFSKRGAFRTEDVSSTDIALGYTLRIKVFEIFLRGSMANIFDEDAVVNPNTTQIITRRTGGAASNLVAFNPKTDTPVECTQRQAAPNQNRCAVTGAHWLKGDLFGKASGVSSYQIPRTYNFSVGFRF